MTPLQTLCARHKLTIGADITPAILVSNAVHTARESIDMALADTNPPLPLVFRRGVEAVWGAALYEVEKPSTPLDMNVAVGLVLSVRSALYVCRNHSLPSVHRSLAHELAIVLEARKAFVTDAATAYDRVEADECMDDNMLAGEIADSRIEECDALTQDLLTDLRLLEIEVGRNRILPR